jgi:hypothetical protein
VKKIIISFLNFDELLNNDYEFHFQEELLIPQEDLGFSYFE